MRHGSKFSLPTIESPKDSKENHISVSMLKNHRAANLNPSGKKGQGSSKSFTSMNMGRSSAGKSLSAVVKERSYSKVVRGTEYELELACDDRDHGTWENEYASSIYTSRREDRAEDSCSHVTTIQGSSSSNTLIPCFDAGLLDHSRETNFLAAGQKARERPPPSSQPKTDISATVDKAADILKIPSFQKELEREREESAPSTEKVRGSLPEKDPNAAEKLESAEKEIQSGVITELKPNCIKSNDSQYALVQSIEKLFQQEFAGVFEQLVSKKGGWRLFCLTGTGNSLLAFIIYRVEGEALVVGNLAVPKEQRRKGYGKKMIRHVIQWGKKNTQCNYCCLCSLPNAVKFYQRIGFRISDTQEKIKMWRKISSGKVPENSENSLKMIVSTSGEKYSVSSGASTASEETRLPDDFEPEPELVVGQLYMTFPMKKKRK